MKSILTTAAVALALVMVISPVRAEKVASIQIPLESSIEIQRQDVSYVCNARRGTSSAKLRGVLAAKTVQVSYINAGDISLAVMQVEGKIQIFSNVIAATGAKYVAGQYVWWNNGAEATFSDEQDANAILGCREGRD